MKKFFAGILAGVLLMTSSYVFAETKLTIEAIFGQVKLVVDGKSVDKETLLYNGTTYVPLRAAAETLGMEVGWDGATNTASLTSKATAPVATPTPTTAPAPTPTPAKSEYTFGETFSFDDLSITFGKSIKWDTVDNRFSDLNGQAVFAVPITIKNNKSETHGLNMFYYKQYGTKGTELDSVRAYFDDEVSKAGNMLTGATQNSYMYLLYDGNGDYVIEFNNFSQKVTVKLSITK